MVAKSCCDSPTTVRELPQLAATFKFLCDNYHNLLRLSQSYERVVTTYSDSSNFVREFPQLFSTVIFL